MSEEPTLPRLLTYIKGGEDMTCFSKHISEEKLDVYSIETRRTEMLTADDFLKRYGW